jgi:hypothetical protein
MSRYSFRGKGSDKVSSLRYQTRRGKINRNTPKVEETGNLGRRPIKNLRRRKWSSYKRRWRITWFGAGKLFFGGLSFPEHHFWIRFRCS